MNSKSLSLPCQSKFDLIWYVNIYSFFWSHWWNNKIYTSAICHFFYFIFTHKPALQAVSAERFAWLTQCLRQPNRWVDSSRESAWTPWTEPGWRTQVWGTVEYGPLHLSSSRVARRSPGSRSLLASWRMSWPETSALSWMRGDLPEGSQEHGKELAKLVHNGQKHIIWAMFLSYLDLSTEI